MHKRADEFFWSSAAALEEVLQAHRRVLDALEADLGSWWSIRWMWTARGHFRESAKLLRVARMLNRDMRLMLYIQDGSSA